MNSAVGLSRALSAVPVSDSRRRQSAESVERGLRVALPSDIVLRSVDCQQRRYGGQRIPRPGSLCSLPDVDTAVTAGGNNMASGGDFTEAVDDVTAYLTAVLTPNDAPARPTVGTVTRLDILPLEILEKMASWLDWQSRLSLGCV